MGTITTFNFEIGSEETAQSLESTLQQTSPIEAATSSAEQSSSSRARVRVTWDESRGLDPVVYLDTVGSLHEETLRRVLETYADHWQRAAVVVANDTGNTGVITVYDQCDDGLRELITYDGLEVLQLRDAIAFIRDHFQFRVAVSVDTWGTFGSILTTADATVVNPADVSNIAAPLYRFDRILDARHEYIRTTFAPAFRDESPSPSSRLETEYGHTLAVDSAIEVCAALLEHDDTEVRTSAATELADIAGKNDDSNTRERSLHQVVHGITRGLTDPSETVRHKAGTALIRATYKDEDRLRSALDAVLALRQDLKIEHVADALQSGITAVGTATAERMVDDTIQDLCHHYGETGGTDIWGHIGKEIRETTSQTSLSPSRGLEESLPTVVEQLEAELDASDGLDVVNAARILAAVTEAHPREVYETIETLPQDTLADLPRQQHVARTKGTINRQVEESDFPRHQALCARLEECYGLTPKPVRPKPAFAIDPRPGLDPLFARIEHPELTGVRAEELLEAVRR